MVEIKRIGVLSLAKLQAIVMAILGLLIGIMYAILGTVIASLASAQGQSLGILAGLGFLSIIILPIFYGIMGFVSGAIGAFLYNLIAGWIGGIELEFSK